MMTARDVRMMVFGAVVSAIVVGTVLVVVLAPAAYTPTRTSQSEFIITVDVTMDYPSKSNIGTGPDGVWRAVYTFGSAAHAREARWRAADVLGSYHTSLPND